MTVSKVIRLASILLLVAVVSSAVAAPFAASGVSDTKNADLFVEPEPYISEPVDSSTQNGTRIYESFGPRYEITPNNFQSDNVVRSGVRGDTGSLTYDRATNKYIFETDTDGTYNVYWDVNRTVTTQQQRGNTTVNVTQTTQVRYEAVLSVEDTSYTHVPTDEYDETSSDAQNWTALENSIQSVYGEDVNIENKVRIAVAYLTFLADPLSALTGGYIAALLTAVTEPGGILFQLTVIGTITLTVGSYIIYANRRARTDRIRRELDEQEATIEDEQRKKSASLVTPYDFIHDDNAADVVSEDLGSNLQDAWDTFRNDVYNPTELLVDRLGLMAAEGYVAVEDDDGLHVVTEDEADGKTIELTDINAEQAYQLRKDETVVKFPAHQTEASPEDLTVDMSVLTDRISDDKHDAEDKERYAEWMVQLASQYRQHDITNTDGETRPIRLFLERLLRLSLEAEKYDLPESRYYTEQLLYLLDDYSVTDDARDIVNEVRRGKRGDDDDE